MLHIPISRWGEPYKSLDLDKVVHFDYRRSARRGQPGQRRPRRARHALCPPGPRRAARDPDQGPARHHARRPANSTPRPTCRWATARRSPDQFARMQSATTGLPEHMCQFNMEKNQFVLVQHGQDPRLAHARPRSRHPLARLRRRGARRAGQLPGAIAGPGHGAAEQLARRAHAVAADHPDAGRPGPQARPARAVDALPHDARRSSRPACRSRRSPSTPAWATSAPRCWQHCPRSLIFGGTATVEQYKGNPRVQAHGPGFSKILLGDDKVDEWEKYLDIMVDSVFVNSGRGCINCSGVWASRHGKQDRRGHRREDRPGGAAAAGRPRSRPWPRSRCRARPTPSTARSTQDLKEPGVHRHDRQVRRAARQEGTLRLPAADRDLCESPEKAIAKKEYMFPFATVVECPQKDMLETIGPTLVCSAITEDAKFQRRSPTRRTSTG